MVNLSTLVQKLDTDLVVSFVCLLTYFKTLRDESTLSGESGSDSLLHAPECHTRCVWGNGPGHYDEHMKQKPI